MLVERVAFDEVSPSLQAEWELLLSQSTRPSIYGSFDYLATSVAIFVRPTGVEPFLLFMRERQSRALRAIFPMSIGLRKFRQRPVRVVEHSITTHNSDVDKPYPIIHREDEAACWQQLADYLKFEFTDWDWLEYDELIAESMLNSQLSKLFPRPKFWTRHTPGPLSPTVDLSVGWQNFWHAHRNMRKKYRRAESRLGDSFRYEVFHQPQQMAAGLAYYIQVEKMSWKSGKGLSEPESEAFYQTLLPKLASQGRAFIGIMFAGDIPVSVEISFVYQSRVSFAHGTYNPNFQSLSPGSVSTSRFLEFFFDKGFKEGDFLAGFAHYIDPWADDFVRTNNTRVFRINRLFFFYLVQRMRLRLKNRLHRFLGRK